jgi:hypothetical protein
MALRGGGSFWGAAAIALVGCGGPREQRAPARQNADPSLPSSVSVPAATSTHVPDAERLYVTTGSIDVLAGPTRSAASLGSVRAGGNVELDVPPIGRPDGECPQGWYAVAPRGFVCAREGTTRDAASSSVRLFGDYHLAARAALPASFGISAMTPVYLRIPTFDEQVRSEPGIEQHLHRLAALREQQDAARAAGEQMTADRDLYPVGVEVPDELRSGTLAPLAPRPLLAGSPVTGLLNPGAHVAWVGELDSERRTWLLTPDFLFVPRDKVKRAVVSGFHGTEISAGQGIAFVGQRPAHRFRKVADKRRFAATGEVWAPSTSIPLAEPATRWSDDKFLETTDPGVFLRTDEVIVVHPTPPARWALDPEGRFIEISAKTHVLLLHEGARISFATLVSVGSNGIPRGKFRIFSKHLTLAGPFDHPRKGATQAEVPEVMLVSDTPEAPPFPIFAAWWVTSWGTPNIGSGVAVAPLDARRVFDWVAPGLPEGWHSVRGDGTWVVVRD